MNKEIERKLKEAGIDVDSALERFMGNEMLLLRFLKKFLADSNYKELTEALEKGDEETALRASHTLKGVCGNLSMTVLYDYLNRQVACIREKDLKGARELMDLISPSYEKACGAIRELG